MLRKSTYSSNKAMRNKNNDKKQGIISKLNAFCKIAEMLENSGNLDKALIYFSNPAAWKNCIEEAKSFIFSQSKYSDESRPILKELVRLQDLCKSLAQNNENEQITNLIIDNIMQPLASLSPIALEDYLRILSSKIQDKRIIDEHSLLMSYIGNYITSYAIHPKNRSSEVYIEGEKRAEKEIICFIIGSYIKLCRVSEGFVFYKRYIKNDSIANKKQYNSKLKSNIIKILKNYENQEEYNEFYEICYGALPPLQSNNPFTLFINSEIENKLENTIVKTMKDRDINAKIVFLDETNQNPLLTDFTTTTTATTNSNSISSQTLSISDSNESVKPETLITEVITLHNDMKYSESYEKLKIHNEVLKENYPHLFYIQELLCMIGAWYLKDSPIQITEDEILKKFKDYTLINDKFDYIYTIIILMVKNFNEEYIIKLTDILNQLEQNKSSKLLSNFLLLFKLIKEYDQGIDNSLKIHKCIPELYSMSLPKPVECQIAEFAKSFYFLESEKNTKRRVDYLQYAQNACKRLIAYGQNKCENSLDLGLIYLKLGRKELAANTFKKLVEEYPLYGLFIDKFYNNQSKVEAFDELCGVNMATSSNIEEIKEEKVVINEIPKIEPEVIVKEQVKKQDNSENSNKVKEKHKSKRVTSKEHKSWSETIIEKQSNHLNTHEINKHFKNKIGNALVTQEKPKNFVCTYNIAPDFNISSEDKTVIFPIIEDNIARMNIMLNKNQLSKHLTKEQFAKLEEFLQDPDKCRIARDSSQDGIKNYANKVIGIKLLALGDLRCIGYCKFRIKPNEEQGVDLIVIDRVVNHKELEAAIKRYNKDNLQLRKM